MKQQNQLVYRPIRKMDVDPTAPESARERRREQERYGTDEKTQPEQIVRLWTDLDQERWLAGLD